VTNVTLRRCFDAALSRDRLHVIGKVLTGLFNKR